MLSEGASQSAPPPQRRAKDCTLCLRVLTLGRVTILSSKCCLYLFHLNVLAKDLNICVLTFECTC